MIERGSLMKRLGAITWVFVFLFIIGIAKTFVSNPIGFLIPIVIFVLIFYFLKHPKKLLNKREYRPNKATPKPKKYRKHKENPFKVIPGKKDQDK